VIEENEDKEWFTIDRDELLKIAEEQSVMEIPSLLVFKSGKN